MPGKTIRYRIELGKWEKTTLPEQGLRMLIVGHRNPDTDSVAAAAAYSALKNKIGEQGYEPICAGVPQKRTRFIFEKFGIPLPRVVSDVWPKVGDIVRRCPNPIREGHNLLDAMEMLRKERLERLPVVGKDERYLGMVSLFDLADRLFKYGDESGEGILDRSVNTSINLASQALKAEELSTCEPDGLELLQVYVGAMNLYHLKSRISEYDPRSIALVVGDRGEIHQLAVELGIRLLIVTGNSEIDASFVDEAKKRGVSVLRTSYDSASTIRRLKFSSPVENSLDRGAGAFHPEKRLRDIRGDILHANFDIFPVVDDDGKLVGVFHKESLQKKPPFGLVFVDHNELSQAVDGAEDVPVFEIVDHHRLAMRPTETPIRVLNDIVGSTCTLIAEQYRQMGVKPGKKLAGVLLGGIVTDTLLLRSPTSTPRDKIMIDWLADVAKCDPAEFEKEILASGSPLANLSPVELVDADLKRYSEGGVAFAIGQIEEAGFENLSSHREALQEELKRRVAQDGLDFIALLITNVVRSTSVMLAEGDEALLDRLALEEFDEGLYDLPGVVSRKKQLLPMILNVL